MKILAIETSCDETAIALIKAKGSLDKSCFKIFKNLVASQIKIHQPFGGVVPNLAKREHLKNLPVLMSKIKGQRLKISDIDLIAVTVGPGLEPCLWTGINFAKDLAEKWKKPLIGISHLEGHLYSFLFSQKIKFPTIALIISGGHTIILKMDSFVKYGILGETLDDAIGESFDKVARLLTLSYPGGPEIEKLAKLGNSETINFPRPMLNQKNYNFSFSGLKTAVLYYFKDKGNVISDKEKADIAASFQKAAFDVLIKKTLRAAEEFNAKSIFLTGGVAANKTLAKEFKKAINNLNINLHITKHPTDNAAMIAAAAYINYLRKKNRRLVANGNLSL